MWFPRGRSQDSRLPELLPLQNGVGDEGDKSPTAATGGAIAPDGGIVCELFERGVHAKFSLLDTGDAGSPAALRGNGGYRCS